MYQYRLWALGNWPCLVAWDAVLVLLIKVELCGNLEVGCYLIPYLHTLFWESLNMYGV